MSGAYRSIDEASRAFDAYARIEPRLRPLWELCRRAAPPLRDLEHGHDAYDVDPFEGDVPAADKPSDGWCAEDYFLEHVKPKLLLVVGSHRTAEPDELHGREAYDTIYDLLINWALDRPCECCAERGDDGGDPWHRGDDASPAYR
jgi:hypothetical protein